MTSLEISLGHSGNSKENRNSLESKQRIAGSVENLCGLRERVSSCGGDTSGSCPGSATHLLSLSGRAIA